MFYVLILIPRSIRSYQCCGDPQLQHPVLQHPYQFHPLPNSHPRRRPRMGPCIQCVGQHARRRRHAARRRDPPIPKQHNHLGLKKLQRKQTRYPIRRIRNLLLLLRPCRPTRRKPRLHGHPRLRQLHGVRALHRRRGPLGRLPRCQRPASPLPLPQRHGLEL